MKINLRKYVNYILTGSVIFFSMSVLGGCGAGTMVVLLPEADDSVGEVTVTAKNSSQVLDQAYQSVKVKKQDADVGKPVLLDPAQVQELFGEALEMQPMPPMIFILYFETGGTDLIRISKALLLENISEIKKRQFIDISVIGHTDRVGSVKYNWELSVKRAKYIADFLIAEGIDPSMIEITFHGERNPLVPTEDGVAEQKNRRVEVIVR